jgi:hypothetical protein
MQVPLRDGPFDGKIVAVPAPVDHLVFIADPAGTSTTRASPAGAAGGPTNGSQGSCT